MVFEDLENVSVKEIEDEVIKRDYNCKISFDCMGYKDEYKIKKINNLYNIISLDSGLIVEICRNKEEVLESVKKMCEGDNGEEIDLDAITSIEIS